MAYTALNWMSQLAADRMLHQITIPGTHDSATHELNYPSKTQNATVPEQLDMGVRYFDLRMDGSTNGLRIIHGGTWGSGNTSYYLGDIAKMFHDFLVKPASSQETLIVQLKYDRWELSNYHAGVLDILRTAFGAEQSRLYLSPIRADNTIPTLAGLRGKLVVLRRYEIDTNEEVADACTPVKMFAKGSLYNAWSANPDNHTWASVFEGAKFEWPDTGANLNDYRNRHGLSFVIQDAYTDDPADKVKKVLAFIEAAGKSAGPDSWYLNFSSTKDPGASAEIINPQLTQKLDGSPKHPVHGYGTILMDFVTPSFVNSVIAANF
ncbi:MAG: phosphatidylinositol-specific phospholipase C domain-containing protein [Azospirillaceae bacterium]|nr:phosphatidylinositol-specific phospholipase C domain-containing protein [Azospirillaceae bacterium]